MGYGTREGLECGRAVNGGRRLRVPSRVGLGVMEAVKEIGGVVSVEGVERGVESGVCKGLECE